MVNIRCSSLPLLARCSASLTLRGETHIDPWNDAAAAGTAVHAALEEVVRNGEVSDSRKHMRDAGVPEDLWDECDMLIAFGRKQWDEYGHNYPIPDTEVSLEHAGSGVNLTGTIDVLSVGSISATIQDWKTGRLDSDHWHQMRGYAFLVVANFPEIETVKATVVRLREMEQETCEWDADDLWKWWESTIVKRIVGEKGTFKPGAHCAHCPAGMQCTAKSQVTNHALAVLAQPEPNFAAMSPERLGNVYAAVGMIERACAATKDAIKSTVQACGPLPLGDGLSLALKTETRETLEPIKAWEVLSPLADEAELSKAVRISKTAALSAVMAKAGRGMKGKAAQAAMEQLRAVGAVKETRVASLRVVRTNGKELAE